MNKIFNGIEKILNMKSDFQSMLKTSAIGCIYIVIFSGKMSLERVIDPVVVTSNFEIRYFFIPITYIFSLILLFKNSKFKIDKSTLVVAISSIVFYLLILSNFIIFGGEDLIIHIVDVISIIITIPILIIIFKNQSDLITFCYFAIAGGVFFFIIALLGLGDTEHNPGWAPYGGPITLYKIQFVSFCCAIYLHNYIKKLFCLKILLLTIGIINLYTMFMTLSKTPIISTLVSLSLLCYILYLHKKYKLVMLIYLLLTVSFSIFYLSKGDIIVNRFKDVFDAEDELSEILLGNRKNFDRVWNKVVINNDKLLIFDQDDKNTIKNINCFVNRNNLSSKCHEEEINCTKKSIILYNSIIFIGDNSDRLKMLHKSFYIGKNNLIFGLGLGNYLLTYYNKYERTFCVYKYPHNIFAEIFYGMGIVGLLILNFWLLIVITVLGRLVFNCSEIGVISAIVVFLLLSSLFSGNYYDFRIVVFISLIIVSIKQYYNE